MGGGSLEDFLNLKFLAKKGFSWVYERCRKFLGGIVLFISSIKSTITISVQFTTN